jgi:hypothetical protein
MRGSGPTTNFIPPAIERGRMLTELQAKGQRKKENGASDVGRRASEAERVSCSNGES